MSRVPEIQKLLKSMDTKVNKNLSLEEVKSFLDSSLFYGVKFYAFTPAKCSAKSFQVCAIHDSMSTADLGL
jgi:hypothetical protein